MFSVGRTRVPNWFKAQDRLRPPISDEAKPLYVFFDQVPLWLDMDTPTGETLHTRLEANTKLKICKACLPLNREVTTQPGCPVELLVHMY